MEYYIEVYDRQERRVACLNDVPLVDAECGTADRKTLVRGMLPSSLAELGVGYEVRVFVEDRLFCAATVTRVLPQWSDTRKLIRGRYVDFHAVLEFEAEQEADHGNGAVSATYTNQPLSAMVKDAINRSLGPVHYTVAHCTYPDGAQREWLKLESRRGTANELEVDGIAAGQWVGADRIDAGEAWAKDGDTIAGLVVDGTAWPDLRLMMVDSEELSRNAHAVKRHPEVADWTDEEYAASGYWRRARAAQAALQAMLDTKGIGFVELNPHRNAAGEFDDRVDRYGRYIGLVYGGGECFNAALVEQGYADIYLYEDGAYHDPAMALKEYFSYVQCAGDSVADTSAFMTHYDFEGGLYEMLTALAYAAGGWVWSVDADLCVRFRTGAAVDRVVFHDSVMLGAALGTDDRWLRNVVYFSGHPQAVSGSVSAAFKRPASVAVFGERPVYWEYYSVLLEEDAERLTEPLLDDLAWPEAMGHAVFRHGDGAVRVGDLLEFRDGPLRRLDPIVEGQWGGVLSDRLAARVDRVAHRLMGRRVETTVGLTSPRRSVSNPLGFMVRSQPNPEALFQFRLDAEAVGLDMGFHLD